MSETPLSAVLFDLDDTLHDRTAAGRLRAARWVDRYLPSDSLAERTQKIEWLIALDSGGYGSKSEILCHLRRLCPTLEWDEETFTRLFVEALFEHMTLAEDVGPLLDALRINRVPWGIVTNGSTTQRDKIVHLGLDGLTGCVFISGEFGCKKPDHRIFDAAAECLGLPPAQILFVGDHCELDILGAHRAGMKTAWLAHGRVWPPEQSTVPDHVLASLADVRPLLNLATSS